MPIAGLLRKGWAVLSQGVRDRNGNEALRIGATASAVNDITITNAATGNAPKLAASGDDTNVGLDLSSKGTGSVTLWTGDGGREALILANTASAVNEVTITQAATGNAPLIAASGETNVGLDVSAKGTGALTLWTGNRAREALILPNVASAVNEVTITQAATGAAPLIAASGETNVGLGVSAKGTGTLTLWTGEGAREALILPNVASAVNEVTITQAAANTAPTIGATGGDTHVSLKLDAKGTAVVAALDPFTWGTAGATADTTAGALTVTAAMILSGIMLRDPNGGNRTDTMSTAALLVAAIPGAHVGQIIPLRYINNADAAETITIAAGTGGTLKGQSTQTTIAQNGAKTLYFVLTNVTGGMEAYDLYVC